MELKFHLLGRSVIELPCVKEINGILLEMRETLPVLQSFLQACSQN